MAARPQLSAELVAEPALNIMQSFHADTLAEVKAALATNPVVVIGMMQNPHCIAVRKNLDAAGVSYKYLEYGSYLSQWKKRLAIKLWSGWPTFPQVYVHGALIGGNREMKAALADGSFRQRLANK